MVELRSLDPESTALSLMLAVIAVVPPVVV